MEHLNNFYKYMTKKLKIAKEQDEKLNLAQKKHCDCPQCNPFSDLRIIGLTFLF